MEDLNTPLLDIVNRKLSETDTNCADPFGTKLASPIIPTELQTGSQASAAAVVTTEQQTTTEQPEVTTTTTTEEPEVTTTTSTTTTTPDEVETASGTTQQEAVAEAKPEPTQAFTTQYVDNGSGTRRKVIRDNSKPEKPYRPPKTEL